MVAIGLGKALSSDVIGFLKTVLGFKEGNISNEFDKVLIPLLGGLGSILLMFNRLARVMQPISLRMAHFARLPNYSEELGFQHAVIEDIKFLSDALQKKRSNTKVILFIDDLDRCSEQRIIEVLQAIILILAPAEFFMILGIDRELCFFRSIAFFDFSIDVNNV